MTNINYFRPDVGGTKNHQVTGSKKVRQIFRLPVSSFNTIRFILRYYGYICSFGLLISCYLLIISHFVNLENLLCTVLTFSGFGNLLP